MSIDPLFAETVNLNDPYHLFVQLNDAAAEGAAVINKTATSFEVRELRNGSSDAAFSYRLVAKRKAYEQHRLEQAPDAADDPNLYPEKRSEWEARHSFDVPAVVPVPPPPDMKP
ncbi:MAG: hypothetical protein M3178_05245 [Pseudomonadota bacterium]|nr:hypothetical protein [Pseudomonadota bacterium]